MDKNVILNSHTQLLALKISGTQLVHLPTKQSTNNTLEYCIVSEFSWAELLSPSEDVLETDNIRLKGKDNQAQHYGFTLCWDLYSYMATGFYYLYIYIYIVVLSWAICGVLCFQGSGQYFQGLDWFWRPTWIWRAHNEGILDCVT